MEVYIGKLIMILNIGLSIQYNHLFYIITTIILYYIYYIIRPHNDIKLVRP